jgi:hypothetical protein
MAGMLRNGRKGVEDDYRGSFEVQEPLSDEHLAFFAIAEPRYEGRRRSPRQNLLVSTVARAHRTARLHRLDGPR